MTADDRLALIRVKVERAKEHVRDLEIEVRSFLVANPYVVEFKRDAQTGEAIHYVISVRETPITMTAIIGDVLHNLRSALDHLAYQLVIVSGATPSKQTYFPISDDATKYKVEAPGKITGMSKTAVKAIDAIKPYKGGDDMLWRLHRLNIIDKHRALITVGSALRSLNIGAYGFRRMQRELSSEPYWTEIVDMPPLDAFYKVADRLFPLKEGDVLFIDKDPDPEVDEQMHFRFDVAFGESGIAEGEPLLETLSGMADRVDDVILSFKPLV
jgi:hypothetical protein